MFFILIRNRIRCKWMERVLIPWPVTAREKGYFCVFTSIFFSFRFFFVLFSQTLCLLLRVFALCAVIIMIFFLRSAFSPSLLCVADSNLKGTDRNIIGKPRKENMLKFNWLYYFKLVGNVYPVLSIICFWIQAIWFGIYGLAIYE